MPEQESFIMQMLLTRDIRAGGYFRCVSGPHAGCYRISRSGRIFDLDGKEAALTENDIWEMLDQVEKIERTQFEGAVQKKRGQPEKKDLEEIAAQFAHAYEQDYTRGAWMSICRYDEETIRKILEKATDHISGGQQGLGRQKLFEKMFREVALAKAVRAARR